MPAKRTPLVVWEDVIRGFAAALRKAGIDASEAAIWEPALIFTRISRLERGTSSSPERQLSDILKWCVKHGYRPALLSAEETSGSIYRKYRRVMFEELFEDLLNERILDPETGRPVKRFVCWMFDRFTRDPEEGGQWLRAMLERGVDLHETHWDEPPKPLYQIQNELRDKWVKAAHEVEQTRTRIMDELRRKAEQGIPTYGLEEMFGHSRYVDPETGITAGYHADPLIKKVTESVARRIIDGASEYSILCWFNENGYRNAAGNKWTPQNLKRFLRAPRLAGLLRLRTDKRRIYDKDYEGDLYPAELMCDEGEDLDPDFVPPIEPLIPFPLWAELQETLLERTIQHGPHEQHFASGFIRCPVPGCNAGLVADGNGSYGCPKPHLRGIRRTNGRPAGAAHDGYTHPSMKRPTANMFLEELIFAVVEREFDPDDAEVAADMQAKRDAIDSELETIDEDRENYAYLLKMRQISRPRYDEWLSEANAKADALRQERRRYIGSERLKRLPRGVTLRSLWPGMTLESRREWLEIVFAEIILRPASPGSLAVAGRFEITFRNGYTPLPTELERLLAAIEEKVQRECRQRRAHNRRSQKVEDYVFALYEQRVPPARMKERLQSHPDEEIRGHDWSSGNLWTLLQRLCKERGVDYAPEHVDRFLLSLETRELMLSLYRQLRGWAAVAYELNRLGVLRPNGAEWHSNAVRDALLRHADSQGIKLPRPKGAFRMGRPNHLSDAMRHQLWKMHFEQKMTYKEIATWLNQRGIKTAMGKTHWHPSTVKYIVNVTARERRKQQRRHAA